MLENRPQQNTENHCYEEGEGGREDGKRAGSELTLRKRSHRLLSRSGKQKKKNKTF